MMRRLFLVLCFILCCSCLFLDNAQSLRRRDKEANFFVPNGAFQPIKKQEKLPSVEQMHYQGEQAPVIIEIEQEKLAQQEAEKKRLEQQKRKADIEKKAIEMKERHLVKNKKINKKEEIKNTEIIPIPEKEKLSEVEDKNIEKISLSGYEQIMYEYKQDLDNISKGLPIENPRLEQMISDFNDEVHTVE